MEEISFHKFSNPVFSPPDEKCCICLSSLQEPSAYQDASIAGTSRQVNNVLELQTCKHMFHLDCLKASYENDLDKKSSLTCPYCKTVYGIIVGDQPLGEMHVGRLPFPLPGFPSCATIHILYHFSGGIQGPNHPRPGHPYFALDFPRSSFLPDNAEGRKVLALLRVAFNRGLIFTIWNKYVVWNDIFHHKTHIHHVHGQGYPDPDYLFNILEELQTQGVTEDDLNL